MNITIQPILEGIAMERFASIANRLSEEKLENDEVRRLIERESNWAMRTKLLNGQTHAYDASIRLLADLRLLKWRVRADNCGIELESPPHPRLSVKSRDLVAQSKDQIRKELTPALAQQFADPSVRNFINRMETPSSDSGQRSIQSLIANGAELADRLKPALLATGKERENELAKAVMPYLQLVPGEGEADVKDPYTQISLKCIWRYFRYTWSIPQTSIPGRQMFYLIRDAAHPFHVVIGIAALSNSALMSPQRDDSIGWTHRKYDVRMTKAAESGNHKELNRLVKHLDDLITNALSEVDPSGLVSAEEIAEPTDDVIYRLQRRSAEFANRREDALRQVAIANNAGVSLVVQETEQNDYCIPPVSTAVLELDKRAPKDTPETLARQLLVAKKRAFEFSRLLRARMTIREESVNLKNNMKTVATLKKDSVRIAIDTAMTSAKSNRVGTNILEITTCGAVAPYNVLLGGKLVALMLLSPEVADDYQRRYGARPTIISSQMKNVERTKDCTLAWLNTTSLFSLGSSQYERLKLPAGTIAPDQPELRYEHIGDTEGYGTVQFSESTVQAVQEALGELRQFKGVNSIFGEGFSPKFRKLNEGMTMLGFNPTILMRHYQTRRMYAAHTWSGAKDFLLGETVELPKYICEPESFRDATERIVKFWCNRWLASRLNHGPSIDSLQKMSPWRLSENVGHLPIDVQSVKSRHRKQAETVKEKVLPIKAAERQDGTDEIDFWRDLAQAGPEACADELPLEKLDSLHVPQPLDDFLLNKVKAGFNIVLTGNAGDGKTHLLRRLEPDLEKIGAEVEADATAAMKPDDVSSILQRWKKAHHAGKPFCLAANEYPLYLLRQLGKGFGPVDEVERQCEHRLAYAVAVEPGEMAREKVLVVDLSLRNPLAAGFVGPLIDKLISQPALKKAAESEPEGDIAWNLRHLSNRMVRQRLLDLFGRLAAAGYRATVRELWIWAARLVLGSGRIDRKPVRSPERWYSSRLFEFDDRFNLSKILQKLGDPAAYSHPRWDYRLETGRANTGWAVDDLVSPMRIDGANFIALKRRFYFEHKCGEELMALDGSPGNDLLKALQASGDPGSAFKHMLIELINRAYCPEIFPEMQTQLYLWIGHRYHEQPSRGHVANQSVSINELDLLRPRIPKRLEGAFDYNADHLALKYRSNSGDIQIRVDYTLFVALQRLRQGLPRQLHPDRGLNRLDVFLEQLRRANIPQNRDFFIHDHNERTTIKVTLSDGMNCYDSVKTHD